MTYFDYAEMNHAQSRLRDRAEQAKLRDSQVFIPGVGGMGGAAFMALVRAGIGRFVIADIDTFEVSNLNRQLFATLPMVGRPKAEVARDTALTINPEVQIEVLGREWTEDLDRLLAASHVAVNGMDDSGAGVHLYRRAKAHGRTVIGRLCLAAALGNGRRPPGAAAGGTARLSNGRHRVDPGSPPRCAPSACSARSPMS